MLAEVTGSSSDDEAGLGMECVFDDQNRDGGWNSLEIRLDPSFKSVEIGYDAIAEFECARPIACSHGSNVTLSAGDA